MDIGSSIKEVIREEGVNTREEEVRNREEIIKNLREEGVKTREEAKKNQRELVEKLNTPLNQIASTQDEVTKILREILKKQEKE